MAKEKIIALIALYAVVFLPSTVFAVTTTDLINYWTLDEESGVRDDEITTWNLSDNNTVLYGTGIISNSADFEASNSEYLSALDAVCHPDCDLAGTFSVSLWIKRESDQSGATLLGKFDGNGGASDRAYVVALDANSSTDLSLNISNGSTATWKYVSYTFNTDTWYHIGISYDATNGEAKFYVNGSQTGSTQSGLPTSIADINEPFRIGAGATGSYFDGLIDEVAIWERELSDQDFLDLYNSGLGNAYPFSSTGGEEMATTSITIGEIYSVFTLSSFVTIFILAFLMTIFLNIGKMTMELMNTRI